MNEKSLKHYIGEVSCLLKDYARQAKVEADHPKEGDSADFNDGFLMAYHQVIAVYGLSSGDCCYEKPSSLF